MTAADSMLRASNQPTTFIDQLCHIYIFSSHSFELREFWLTDTIEVIYENAFNGKTTKYDELWFSMDFESFSGVHECDEISDFLIFWTFLFSNKAEHFCVHIRN